MIVPDAPVGTVNVAVTRSEGRAAGRCGAREGEAPAEPSRRSPAAVGSDGVTAGSDGVTAGSDGASPSRARRTGRGVSPELVVPCSSRRAGGGDNVIVSMTGRLAAGAFSFASGSRTGGSPRIMSLRASLFAVHMPASPSTSGRLPYRTSWSAPLRADDKSAYRWLSDSTAAPTGWPRIELLERVFERLELRPGLAPVE